MNAAGFTHEALESYHGPGGNRHTTVIYHQGYGAPDFPATLGYEASQQKSATALIYKGYDPNYTKYADNYLPYYGRIYPRYPAGTRWMEKMSDGRLAAFAVEDRQVVMWTENTPGGAWTGPTALTSGDPISPSVTVVSRPDGMLQLFALRLPLGQEHDGGYVPAGTPPQDIITAVQTGAAPTWSAWTSLGNPDDCTMTACQVTGAPAAAVDSGSHVIVFARNSRGTVSYREPLSGDWFDLGATEEIIEGIDAITNDSGSVEAFATSRTGRIQHYMQFPYSTSVLRDPLDFPSTPPITDASSAPTVTKNQDGRLEIFYREADTGRVRTAYEVSPGYWTGTVVLYGDAGTGPVAAIRREGTGEIMLFERNVWTGVSTTFQQAPNDIFYPQWMVLAAFALEYPAAATDGLGHAVVAVKGPEGALYINRESSGIGSFGSWAPVGADAPRPVVRPRLPIRVIKTL
jgi:hypothetical protein